MVSTAVGFCRINLTPLRRGNVRALCGERCSANELSRRIWLSSLSSLPAVASSEPGTIHPLVDTPLRRLRLPKGGVGRDYVLVPIDLPGVKGTKEFMLDSGLTQEILTPVLVKNLRLATVGRVEGTTAAGTRGYRQVELKGASVNGVPLPTLRAAVSDFPQEHMDPKHDVVGMAGLEMMDAFDVDIDFSKNRLRLWQRGDGALVARSAGMAELPAALLPSGVVAVRVAGKGKSQPFVGIVDCGSSFSTLNLNAAILAGLSPPSSADKSKNAPKVIGIGVDGKPFSLPLTPAS